MKYERTEILKSFDETDIFFRVYSPRKRERRATTDGVIFALHDFGEHSGRFSDFAENICAKNVAFATFDLRGHGKSGPRKGDAENLAAMIGDVLFFIQHTRTLFGINGENAPFFGILGHGFGALLAIYAAAFLKETCPPLCLSSPIFRLKEKVPFWKKIVTTSLSRVTPFIPLPIDFGGKNTQSINPEAKDTPAKDVNNLITISPRLGDIFLEALTDSKVRHVIGLVNTPTTVVCGANNEFVDVSRIQDLFSHFGTEQTILQSLEHCGHDLFQKDSEGYDQMIKILFEWICNKGQVK